MVKLALFGTGSSAERAWEFLAGQKEVQVTTVLDNDVSKQGAEWNSVPVCSASDLLGHRDWDYVVVASSWHANILRQLLEMGIDAQRIAVFEPWISDGVILGIQKWRWLELFPERMGDDFVIPGFEGDSRVLELLKQLGFAPSVVLDVGASNGVWSATCSRLFPDATYFLVEPCVEYNGRLIDGYDDSWHRLPIALSSEDGTIELRVPDITDGAYDASLASRSHSSSQTFRSYTVEQARFDTLFAEDKVKMPDLVKLDVQGFEAQVLEGATCLWGNVEVFMVELSLRRFWKESKILHEMIALFEARGYLPFELYHPYRNPEGLQSQIDCVFLKKDGRVAEQHGLWSE